MNGIGSYWTPAKMSDLRQLADGSRTADSIAAILGDVTRNAVISKVHRTEGLRLRTTSAANASRRTKPAADPLQAIPQRRTPFALPRVKTKPAPSLISQSKPKPTPTPIDFKPKLIPFAKLKDTVCKYPYGESPPYRFCGCKSVHGLSWCLEHLRIVTASAKAFEGHPQAAGVRKSAREASK